MATIIGIPQSSRLSLDSCKGEPLDNERLSEISPFEVNQFRQFDTAYGFGTERRCDPNPSYNCHGMTFAARRTGIFESNTIWQILSEDQYINITEREDVKAGDVILYFDDSGDFEHSGIVISPPRSDNLYVPVVCSKWGKYAELLHRGNNCPYNFGNVKYYRLQP